MKLNKNLSKLNFKVINVSSFEDNTINSPQKYSKLLQIGGYEWISERFCSYPQEIIIKFDSPVFLYQINLLCNDKKISKHLIFHSFCPDIYDGKSYNQSEISFRNIGFVDLKDNKECNYQVREYKKVFINIKTLFLKIILDNNYVNHYNKFQQVGIINIECLGTTINNNKRIESNNETRDKEKLNQLNNNIEKIIREIIGNKYDIILENFIKLDKKENNNKYTNIKNKIEEMNNTGKKIYQIKLLEKNASNKDDFDKAIELKNKSEKLKNKINEIVTEINKLFENNNNKNNEVLENDNDINEISNINISQINSLRNNNNYDSENKGNKKKILLSLSELDFLKDANDYDDTIIPTVNKKLRKNKSTVKIKEEDENKYKQKLEPLEELAEENLKDYKMLIPYIKEEGLRYLLSNQIGYKINGFEILTNQLNSIFLDDNLIELIYELINLESLFLDDKNNSTIIQSFKLIKKTLNQMKDSESDIKTNKKILKYINERIITKIISKLGDGELKIRSEASKLFYYILKQNLFNFNPMINKLLSNDVNDNLLNSSLNNSQNIKILSKLNIIKNILEEYENFISNNYTTENSFPKELILDYIFMNLKNNKLEIKKIIKELIDLAAQIFGPENVRQKIYFYMDDQKEIAKLMSQIGSLKPILNNGLSKSNSQINITKSKPKKNGLKKNSSQINIKSNSRYKIKDVDNDKTYKNDKNNLIINKNNNNQCNLCYKNLGNKTINEHKKKCLMCVECESCKDIIKVEKLNSHKLNYCKNRKKFKECNKCKEAIPYDLYDLHIKKNVCNIAKENMLRCPLCHHDIEKSDNGFYQHLVIDGCAYQKII